MEYEKSPSAATFSRKMNNRSRSLSFSANAIYDGVFSSPANSKSSMVDYSEIFRGSGPSPSSIPFLDVPELNGGKIKVDVRSTKLDYSSVFGGFGVCDFDGTPKEVIFKSEKKTSKKEDKRNRRKSGNSSEVPRCDEGKNRISSPEMVRMKHSDISHHQAGLRNENGTTQSSQVFTMPAPAPTTQPSQVFTMPGSAPTTQPSQVFTKPGSAPATQSCQVFTKPGSAPTTQSSQVFTKPGPVPAMQSSQVFTKPGPAPAMQPSQVFTKPGPAPIQLVDNVSPLKKIESKAPVLSVEKETCPVAVEEVKVSRKRSSKTEVDFGEIFGRNGSSTIDNSTRKTESVAEHQDVKPPTSLQRIFTGENGASERLMSLISGISERYQSEDTGSPGSPVFFDAESDVDSSAAESSAALKKALEEAQVRMNIAKQMMGRKKSGFLSSPKLKSCDDPKVDEKRDAKVEEIIEEIRVENSHILDEVVNSSEQSFSNEGDQHAKRARKQWEVPEVLLKSTPDHTQEEVKKQEEEKQEEVNEKEVVKQEEVKEQEVVKQEEVNEKEVVKQEEEQARRGRKHWELPGGIFKSVINSKQREPENIVPTTPEKDTKQEVQPSTENPFYTFGQLGNKLKCVVEAFTGSKVSQKDETQVTEKENSFLTHIFQVEESDSQKMLAGIPAMETHFREVEETPQQTESRSETKVEDNSASTMCTSTEESSQKMEKEETEWHVKSACESNGGPWCGVEDFQENPESTYSFLDQEGEREIVTETQEMIVGPDDTRTYVREVEEIPTLSESLSRTQLDESVGAIVSLHKENTSEPENIHEEKATEQKAPRRRRVWKTSEDVYNMIKAPIGNNRPWQLKSTEEETTERPFLVEGVRIHDASKEIESTSQQANDSGLQENWTVLKQMFRQMFQTEDTKGEDHTYCLVEAEKDHIDIHRKTGDENGKETTETSYCQTTGADIYEHNAVEVESEFGAYTHIRESEDLEPAQETYCRKVDGKVEVQGKTALVRELIGEELETTEIASDQEGEDVQEVFEEAAWPQGLSELDEVKALADSRAKMLEYDGSETDSSESCEKFEQRQELADDETKINGSIDTDTSRSSFEMRQGDSYTEEVGAEQDLSDQFHEKNSAVSSTEEHVEEIDSDSIQSGWSVIDDEDKIKSYVEESLAGHLQDGGASTPEEKEEMKEETDEMNSSLGVESNEDKTEQEHQFECQKEEMDRSNVEPPESSCCLPKEDEKIGTKDNDGEESCRSSMGEEGDAASSASQNEAEQVDEHLKKKNEAKEKEREREKERVMVERAIREARERAFADAKERAGKAAIEKAKVKAHRKGTSEVPRRSEKGGSVEVTDKSSSTERVSLQAKLRAERAAVERALSEARERAMEKALSGKSAASSQTRSYGGSKSFSSTGEKRSSSSSQGTENKNSGPSSSSNQTAKGEPIQRCKARSERHQRTSERAAEALAEKKLRDLKAQKEQTERNRFAESLDADVKRWSNGKENNLRALLSTLQYILGAESGWKPIPLTDLVASAAVRKAYRKATLYVHPDKLQQRGASTQQKYICEKVFDLLKEAWNKFGADDK